MRTTIEIPKEQRAELLRLAAKRGLKGFSTLIQEALTLYLKQQIERNRFLKEALQLKGCLKGKEANDFEERIVQARKLWR